MQSASATIRSASAFSGARPTSASPRRNARGGSSDSRAALAKSKLVWLSSLTFLPRAYHPGVRNFSTALAPPSSIGSPRSSAGRSRRSRFSLEPGGSRHQRSCSIPSIGIDAPAMPSRKLSHWTLNLMGWRCRNQRAMAGSEGSAFPSQRERMAPRNRRPSRLASSCRPR